jgi:hypothetical protein
VLFFGFFSALIYWFFVVDKQRMTALSAGILEEDMPATSSHLHHPIEGELP